MKRIIFLILVLVCGFIGYLVYSGKLSTKDLKNPDKVIEATKDELNAHKDEIEKIKDVSKKAVEKSKELINKAKETIINGNN